MTLRRYLTAGVAALALATTTNASLFTIELSTHSSGSVDPSLLSARLDFSVTGQTLTLTVTNNTSGLNSFSINRIYFNASDDVGNLVSSSTGQFSVNAISTNADGFGMFDYVLAHGPPEGHNHHVIGPLAQEIFTFVFAGTFNAKDFSTELSTPFAPGNTLMHAAAKFVMGPNDDSDFGGALIPAPGVLALLAAAGLVGGRRRRRRG